MCGPGGVRYALHVAAEKGSGDWRTGEVAEADAPRLLPPNHHLLAIPGGARAQEAIEPALT
eukprot:gene24870-30310_t